MKAPRGSAPVWVGGFPRPTPLTETVRLRARSSAWCWIISESETGLAEFQCHVMCELYYSQNQVEQTDLAINPNPNRPHYSASCNFTWRCANVLLHQSTRPGSRASHACDREVVSLATHRSICLSVRSPNFARINPTPSTAVQRGRPVAGSSSPSWHLLLGRATVCSGQGKAASLTPRP